MSATGWSAINKSAGIVLSYDDSRATTASGTYNGVLCDTEVVSSEVKYWEIYIPTGAVIANTIIGVALSGIDLAVDFAGNSSFYGFNISTDEIYAAGSTTKTSYGGVTVATGDSIGVALDLLNNELYFSINNTWLAGSNPVTNTSPAITGLINSYYPVMQLLENSGTHDIGDSAFIAEAMMTAPPTGYEVLITPTGLPVEFLRPRVVQGYSSYQQLIGGM